MQKMETRPWAEFGVGMEKVHRLASSWLRETLLAPTDLAGWENQVASSQNCTAHPGPGVYTQALPQAGTGHETEAWSQWWLWYGRVGWPCHGCAKGSRH